MAKLIKGDGVQNIITDGDVIITSPSKIGKTLDEVLTEQQSDIDKLKSNVKYIYAYGGVGGSGSGGSGSGEKPVTVFITLGSYAIGNGGGDIVLDKGKGKYRLHIKLNNAGERTYFMGYSTVGDVSDKMMRQYKLNSDNFFKQDIDIDLNSNGTLNVKIIDSEENVIGYYSQKYIVESETFDVNLNYVDKTGTIRPYVDATGENRPYECFVDDQHRTNRHIKIDYSIFLLNYSEVKIKCQIDGGVGVVYDSTTNNELPKESVEISMDDVLIGGEKIFQDKHMGTYTLTATLSYKISGMEIVRERSFMFNVVPSGLYINVRTSGDVLYDSLDLLEEDISYGIPHKHVTQGSSLMMYCKVFEGSQEGPAFKYVINVKAYDAILNDDKIIIGWSDMGISEDETLTEQVESSKGVSVTFPTGGIKKIIISTKGAKGDNMNVVKDFIKYVYVKDFENKCDWFDTKKHSILGDSYFRANQGINTYKSFPQLSSGNGVLSLTKSSNPIVIDQSELDTPKDAVVCTVITLGIQVSNINSENACIADIYTSASTSVPTYSLKLNTLFADDGTNKIAIPTEVLNKNDNSKYHLIQIIRNIAGFKDGVEAIYEDSLYIDGMLESSAASTLSWSSKITKFILQNINICYNLINIQYFSNIHNSNNVDIKFNPDGYAYQYWLAYKEKYVNSSSTGNRLKEEEIFLKENMNRIFFDGTNVVVESSIIMDIASRSDLPSVVFSYNCDNGEYKKISEFMELMWMGRQNGDRNFNSRKIDLYWVPERSVGKLEDYKVEVPDNFTDNTYGDNMSGNWEIDLQGTSTMRNRIKNYSLRINTQSSTGKDKILFSPKFDINNSRTFLPDVEWTIKADIADSAHANNTSIGKFVNDVCSIIDTNISDITSEAKEFIKNTLEGIPVLMYFMCEGLDDNGQPDVKIYYFGIYNFNLGRNSYYNLGYNGGIVDHTEKRTDHMRVFNNIKNNTGSKYLQDKVFTFAVGECALSDSLTIGEIQENSPQFDFHQYHPTLLFKDEENDNNCMFGSKSKVTSSDFAKAKIALGDLVKGVAKAGKYCFEQSGRKKDFVTSRHFDYDENGNPEYSNVCVNRYAEGKIPDPIYQIQYENNRLKWSEPNYECDNVDISDLKRLIVEFEDGDKYNKPLLNYNSAAEYYTICMAFGMVDSVLKNMNLKNFRSLDQGPNFYCAFYDMDCALEEANDGAEKVSYLAATDYWYSPMDSKNKVSQIEKKNDYWDDSVGSGFDFTSSYLFAVVKYAKAIFNELPEGEERYEKFMDNYPQRFWARLRKYDGELRSADHFIKTYFKSGITTTFEYLASLNYRVKYLYHGYVYDNEGNYVDKYLANGGAFNGSRRIKAKNWLTKRLRFLDLMMNVNSLTIPISDNSMLKVPKPVNYTDELMQNDDITILHSAFDTGQLNQAQSNFRGEVAIYAPAYTPFIFQKGTSSIEMYLLTGGVEKPNLLYLTTTEAEGTRFYGSGLFTSVDKIESMFTAYNSIVSDNLETISYGNTPIRGNMGRGLLVNAKSVRELNLNIPKMGGLLNIHQDCISLEKINIADSEFYGSFEQFPNLQEVNISSVKASQSISVANSEHLTGERFFISGKDEDNKTTLNSLDISGVTGNFICENTSIESIRIKNTTDRNASDFDSSMLSELVIIGDSRLKELHLEGFRKVHIESCNNLKVLSIDDALEEIYIDLAKVKKDEVTSSLVNIPYIENPTDDKKGIFDFTSYLNLNKVTLKNCDNLKHIKLPNKDIETDGMSDNINLEWIDTGEYPSFRDDKSYNGIGKYEGIKFQSYPNGHKLILRSGSTFKNCPKYAMLRSDWDKCEEMAGIYGYIAYTNITVSEDCTSLNDTFNVNNSVSDDKFVMDTAIRFIEKCVPDNVKENIVSLSSCFRGRKNVKYTIVEAAAEKPYESSNYEGGLNTHPILSKYKSLSNISGMYYGTGVKFISKNLLDLPHAQNVKGNTLTWDSFIQGMTKMSIASDALYNISYRLNSYSYVNFTIYEYNDNTSSYEEVGEDNNHMFKICDFFYPFNDGKKIYTEDNGYDFTNDLVPYDHITTITSLNFGDQCIDFRGMFKLFPNVKEISLFLNGCNLSKYNIDGILQPCKNIISISQCFCDIDVNNSTQVVDLFKLFNWEENTTEIKGLFDGPSSNYLMNGFEVKKTITYDNFKTVLKKITEYTKLTRLTNLFSYCTITGYPSDANENEISFGEGVILNNIANISNLFNGCNSDYIPFVNEKDTLKGIYKGGVLNIGRSLFKNLPNVTVVYRTFKDTYLSSSLTYDFFCKRSESISKTQVLLTIDDQNSNTNEAMLCEYTYNSNMVNLEECFFNTKFVNCKNWFDQKDNVSLDRNYIEVGNDKYYERGFVYYVYNGISNTYDEYTLDNDIIDDCLDNYTDFVPQNSISGKGDPLVWYNHDLVQDFIYYGNIKGGDKPFDPENVACRNTIQETYCCLPPDFLYGCASSASVNNIFANSNIIGVIPRNLTKKIRGKSISNMFLNVNIMPNLEYYYDENGGLNESILNKIDLPVNIEGDPDEYTVVFRDKYGKLQRRKPIDGDMNLGQFVYVPSNFTISGNLSKMFNFRYNLPRHWSMPNKPDGNPGYYKTSDDLNYAISKGEIKLPYHNQYYFITDKCVDWNNLFEASSLFISSDQDVDFSNNTTMGRVRSLFDVGKDTLPEQKYSWSKEDSRVITSQGWSENVIDRFYIDLNLCGTKNEYDMLENNGCPIIAKNISVSLDNFVSGILTVFLNGRVFGEDFEVGDLTTANHKNDSGSYIIDYYGRGKNIILPKFNISISDNKFEFIPVDRDHIYYDFMLDGDELSKSNYNDFIVRDRLPEGVNLFDNNHNKYVFK